jgi:hypothetical protein
MWKACQKKRTAKKVLKNILEGKSSLRKSRKRWFEDGDHVLRKLLLERGEK